MYSPSRSILSYLTLALSFATWLRADVVINEIHYDPEPNTEEVEFIELYNSGASSVDVSGWQFTDGVAFILPVSTQIPAGGYLVIGENPTALFAKFSVNSLGPWSGSLSNDGERIVLKNAFGAIMDEVDYGVGFPWPLAARGTGSSMELIHPSLDNDLAGSWRAAGQPSVCANGASTTFIPENSVEWSYHKGLNSPAVDTNSKTWWQHPDFVEDSNWIAGAGGIGYGESFISTWVGDMRSSYSTLFLRKKFTVADASEIDELILRARYDDGVKIWINGTAVFNHFSPGSPSNPSAVGSFATGNRNESEAYVFQSNTLTSPAPSSYLVDGTNVIAIQLFNVTIGSSDCHFDCELKESQSGVGGSSAPSPALRNHSYSTAEAPQARQINHLPEMPAAGQSVLVTSKVTDPDGVKSVTLQYQIVDPGGYIRRADAAYEDAANWTSIPMLDNGGGGDLLSGDTIYTATVPANVQVHRRLIRYRVMVVDMNDHCMRLPYGDDTQPNFSYFCYNGVPSWTGKTSPSSPTVTYPAAELSRVPVYQLIANNTDVENSQWNGSFNERLFEATLVYDGKVYDHIKFRNKGSASTYRTGHNKWKLNFNRGHRFQARDYYGKKFAAEWDKFSIQTSESPWWRNNAYPMSGMLFQESLMTKLNNLAGTHAPEMLHFHFRVIDGAAERNTSDQYDGDFWGIYTAQQHPDKSFFDQNDLPSSNLYKLNGSNAYSASIWNQSSTQVDDASDLQEFIDGYKGFSSEQWWAENLERSAYYNWNTLNLALNNSDLRKEQNVIYWRNAETGRWHPSVWDVDLLFEDAQHHNRDPYAWWEDLHQVLNYSTFEIEYQNRVRELQDLLLWNGQFDRTVDEVVTLLAGSEAGVSANTLVDANQAMWNYHPRKNDKGNWYRIDGSSSWNGLPDMASYMKAFAKPGGFGGDQLEEKSAANADYAIPDKPTIVFTGEAGYPTTGLSFQTSPFSDSSGSATTIQWRVGEIYDPNVSNYIAGEAWKYELSAVWESGEIAWAGDASSISIPVTHIKVGHTYRARVRHKDSTGRWSRWSEPSEFLTTPPDVSDYRNALVVSEIHYHAADPSTAAELGASLDSNDFEFIELMNVGTTTLDLNGVRIADGITFDFTGSSVTTLPAGERVLVVKEESGFIARYGSGQPIAGEYSGNLSNGGELLRLAYGDGDTPGNLIRSFTYDDLSPWPVAADGTGPSMVLQNPWAVPDHNVGSNWRASFAPSGQPGIVDSWNFQAWLRVNGIAGSAATDDADNDGVINIVEYFYGTDPTRDSSAKLPVVAVEPINTGSGEKDYLSLSFERNLNAEGLTFQVQESTELAPWNGVPTPVRVEVTPLGDSIERQRYRSSLPISDYSSKRLFMRVQVSK